MDEIRVLIWNEFIHERRDAEVKAIYPEGIHRALAKNLSGEGFEITCASLDEPECGLPPGELESCDVLVWWSHIANDKIPDALAERIVARVKKGMGFIALHSARNSKPFILLNGTSCKARWREDGKKEIIWVVDPQHPIAAGLAESFELPHEEMYGEPMRVAPDSYPVFMSWFEGGEILRSGCCLERGKGRIFYFQPGHESFPAYYDANVLKVIANAIRWCGRAG